MDTITFWKNYGRDLEGLLDKAHKREVSRLQVALAHDSQYVMAEEKYAFEDLRRLKMIREVVIGMNRSPEVDAQKPNP